ncbi:hypothetical protein B0O80DRAFT_429683 [Mortierella sp. GBAus27b]|nr:hypothetical protein B0O80DRAFT_429683 [Mortierella sp. GBAus27b]
MRRKRGDEHRHGRRLAAAWLKTSTVSAQLRARYQLHHFFYTGPKFRGTSQLKRVAQYFDSTIACDYRYGLFILKNGEKVWKKGGEIRGRCGVLKDTRVEPVTLHKEGLGEALSVHVLSKIYSGFQYHLMCGETQILFGETTSQLCPSWTALHSPS